MAQRLTLEEIGRLAGVSRSTVSRVINDHAEVSAEVRPRVLDVIEQTRYRPNAAARSLVSVRTGLLGLVIPSGVHNLFHDPYLGMLTQGITRAANAAEQTLSLFLFEQEREEVELYERVIVNGLVDGLVVTATTMQDPLVDRMVADGAPFVMVGRPDREGIPYVDVDNRQGARAAKEHLISHGCRRLATVAGPSNSTTGVDRRTGFLGAAADARIGAAGRLLRDARAHRGTGALRGPVPDLRRVVRTGRRGHRPRALRTAGDGTWTPTVTGRHRFTCDAGGRVRVRQGDRLVVDAWHPEPSTATWEAELVAGDAGALQVEFGSVPGPWRHLRIGAELLDDVRAVVHAWYGGQEVGHAVADVLTGRAEPGGRLPVTWPRDSRQHPGLLNFPGEAGRVRYGEGVHVGRRAYDRLGLEPRFPFGHGGSFTRMDLTGVTARRRGDGIVVSGELANVGERDGMEVVLVDACGLGGVARRLVAYEKVRLAAGERCRVDLEVAPEQLRSWDLAAGAWSPAHGRVELEVRTLVSTSHVDVDLGTDGAGARGS